VARFRPHANMTDKRRPVELQMGALRALLRQPDLPPDLAAKIQERTAAEARRQKLDGSFRRRLPVIIVTLAAIAVAAVLALIVMPETSETKPQSVAAPVAEGVSEESGASPVVAVGTVPQLLSNAALPANEAGSVALRSTPTAAISGVRQTLPVAPGQPAGKAAPKPSVAGKAPAVVPVRETKASAPVENKQLPVPPVSKESAPETAPSTQAPTLPDAPAASPVDPAP
jgi:hypothetical protein